MIFGIIIVFILIVTSIVIWTTKCNAPMMNPQFSPIVKEIKETKETFEMTKNMGDKLNNLKSDLKNFVLKKSTGDKTIISNIYEQVMKYDPYNISKNIASLPTNLLTKFNLDGNNIKDPILKMYEKSPELFTRLGETNLLNYLGKTVATGYWSQNAKNKTTSGYEYFTKCLQSINWNDINVWKNIDNASGQVMKCIN